MHTLQRSLNGAWYSHMSIPDRPLSFLTRYSCLGLLLLGSTVQSAELSAWETFWSQANTDAWRLYDFSDDTTYLPNWFSDTPGEEFAYSSHVGDAALWFFTDNESNAGGGKLVGDYAVEEVQAILCDVLIDSLEEFDSVDCAIYATGPAGKGYYYSQFYEAADFSEAGWWTLRFAFDEEWFVYDEETDDFEPITVTPGLMATIEEIGFRFYPKEGSTADSFASIDDVRLQPLVESPELVTSLNGGDFELEFTPEKGLFCWIEELQAAPDFEWEEVEGQDLIVGPDPHIFSRTVTQGSGIFRVQTLADYLPFDTPAAP